jgi:hypothetical protein
MYEWVEFTSDDPCAWTPRGGEEEDIDTDESDERFLSGLVGSWGCDADDCDDVFANTHSCCADEEELSATEVIDCPDTRES